MPASVAVVVPCFNEEKRLDISQFREFLTQTRGTRLVLVDDGSTDGTRALLRALARQNPRRVSVLGLDNNCGKAEAVRLGMLHAFGDGDSGIDIAGYWDADLSAPLSLVPKLARVFVDRPELWMVFGSRVRMLGRDIRRDPWRHYAGRVFATAASWVVGLAVYDTQCGHKLFRNTAEVRALFEEQFATHWIFDLEIIARAARSRAAVGAALGDVIYEYPLEQWHGKAGSKLRQSDFVRAAVDLARIRLKYFSRGPG